MWRDVDAAPDGEDTAPLRHCNRCRTTKSLGRRTGVDKPLAVALVVSVPTSIQQPMSDSPRTTPYIAVSDVFRTDSYCLERFYVTFRSWRVSTANWQAVTYYTARVCRLLSCECFTQRQLGYASETTTVIAA